MSIDIEEGSETLPAQWFSYGKILSAPQLKERYLKVGSVFIFWGLFNGKNYSFHGLT